MAHFEKRISGKTLFEGHVFNMTLDTVELENGKTASREVVHHNGGACVVALNEKCEIYLVRQFRYPYAKEIIEIPAGKLEKGENPKDAAIRELREECGVKAENIISLGEFYPTVAYCTEVIYIYLATGLSTCEMNLDDDEFLTPELMPLQKAYEMVMSSEICDGKTITGILKTKALLDEGKI